MTAEPIVLGSWYETTEIRLARIVVPTLPRAGYDLAFSMGARLAAELGCELHMMYVGDLPNAELEALRSDASAAHPELHITSAVVAEGDSAAGAMAEALERTDLVVMSTNAAVGDGVSFAQSLTDNWDGAVMMLGPQFVEDHLGPGGVAVALDGSAMAERALPVGRHLAEALERQLATVEVVSSAVSEQVQRLAARGERVSESGYLADLVARLDAAGVPATWTVVHGDDPAAGLIEYASSHDASLLVMATHGRGGLPRPAFGSTCLAVVAVATIPVVVVRPTVSMLRVDTGTS